MKKMIIFLAIVIALFVALAFVTNMSNEEKVHSEDNPYNKETLKTETIELLDDEHYQNIITPEQLEKKLANNEDVTVYFFKPNCPACRNTTPIVAPLAKEMGIDLVLYNLWEFEQGWDEFAVEYTPTIVHYKNGEETARIVSYHEEKDFKTWFNEYVK